MHVRESKDPIRDIPLPDGSTPMWIVHDKSDYDVGTLLKLIDDKYIGKGAGVTVVTPAPHHGYSQQTQMSSSTTAERQPVRCLLMRFSIMLFYSQIMAIFVSSLTCLVHNLRFRITGR